MTKKFVKIEKQIERKDPFSRYNVSTIALELLPPFPGCATVIKHPHLFREG